MVDETQEQLAEALEPLPEPPAPESPEPPEPEAPVGESQPTPPPQEPEGHIPPWRLREEAEARRAAEDRARALETRLQQIDQHLRQRRAQQPQDQSNWFENPDAATQAAIERVLVPYAQQTQQILLFMGRQVAEARHGSDKVAEAEKAFLEARDDRSLDPADFNRVVQAPNRYDAVVQWHKRHAALRTVGEDPNAWFEKQLEARLADPKFQSTLLERVQKEAAARPGVTKLPPSLSRSTAAVGNGGEPIGDLSDASLFAFAMKE